MEAAKICQRKGFEVEFIPEKNDERTPEFFVSNKKGQRYEVECKSLDQKTVDAQKEDSILANAFKYAKTNQKKRRKFYTFAILAEEKIGFHDYKNIFDSTIKSKTHVTPGNIDTETGEIEYEKLDNKKIYYAAKYNGATGEELPSDYCNGLLNLPLHNHIVEFKGRQGDKKCKDVFSIHTITPYTRDIVKSIVTRFETARKQISSDSSGFIFIKIPEAHFSDRNIAIVEDSVEEIKKKFTPDQNTRIGLVAIMSSAFEIGEDNDLTFMKCVFIHNPHARPAADEFMK